MVLACVKLGTMFASGTLIAYTRVGTVIACVYIGTINVNTLAVILRINTR